jgi:hypothetical protein
LSKRSAARLYAVKKGHMRKIEAHRLLSQLLKGMDVVSVA